MHSLLDHIDSVPVGEKEITDRQSAMEQLLDCLPDAHAIWSGSRIKWANKAFAQLFGVELAQLVGKAWQGCFAANAVQILEHEVMHLLNTQGSWQGILDGFHRSKQVFTISAHLKKFENGDVICACNIPQSKADNVQVATKQNRLLVQLSNLQTHQMTHSEDRQSFGKLLDILLEHTQCQCGFVSEFTTTQTHQPILKLHAQRGAQSPLHLSKGWICQNDGTIECLEHVEHLMACQEPLLPSEVQHDGKEFLLPFLRTLFAQPENMVIIPIMKGSHSIGIIGLGNRDASYDDSFLSDLEPAVTTCAYMIESRRLALARDRMESKMRRQSKELSLANRKLKHTSKMKDQFLASMSHELRTPLAGILNVSEALMEEIYGSLNEAQQRNLKVIEESGRHLLDLINDILDVAKVESGQFQLALAEQDLSQIIASVIRLVKESAAKKDHQIILDEQCPELNWVTDRRRVIQILVNLMSNAIKFTPNGGTIVLRTKWDEEAHGILLEVSDNGPGIAHENQALIFEPFAQLDGGLNRAHSGTGLGLSLVKQLATILGGHVTLHSNPGEGAKFSVFLPGKVGHSDQGAGI